MVRIVKDKKKESSDARVLQRCNQTDLITRVDCLWTRFFFVFHLETWISLSLSRNSCRSDACFNLGTFSWFNTFYHCLLKQKNTRNKSLDTRKKVCVFNFRGASLLSLN